jgi:hypothetical protein
MQFAAGTPAMWRLTLTSGRTMELWAHGYSTEPEDGFWVFDVLVDASAEEQDRFRVHNQTVPASQRCTAVVARIPTSDVVSMVGGWSLDEDPDAA